MSRYRRVSHDISFRLISAVYFVFSIGKFKKCKYHGPVVIKLWTYMESCKGLKEKVIQMYINTSTIIDIKKHAGTDKHTLLAVTKFDGFC